MALKHPVDEEAQHGERRGDPDQYALPLTQPPPRRRTALAAEQSVADGHTRVVRGQRVELAKRHALANYEAAVDVPPPEKRELHQ